MNDPGRPGARPDRRDPLAHAVHVGLGHRLAAAWREIEALEIRLDEEIRERARVERELRQHAAQLEAHGQRIAEQARLVSLQADQLARARDRALASTRAKAAFLAMISHEIRTPLNGIIGMTEFLLGSDLTEEQRDHAMTIERSGGALLALINDVLDFSKVEAGRMQLESVEFHLPAELENALQVVADRAERKGIELALQIGPDVPERVAGDPVRLRQVVLNLLGNAVKFTSQGEVVVSVEREWQDEREVLVGFSVRDSGIGIEPQRVDALFEPFVQADSATARRFGGTGLGLTICKQLVELMGGKIRVESTVGEGSRFSFSVPFGRTAPSDPALRELWSGFAGVRALCIDRNDTSRRTLTDQLARLGMETMAAATVDQGLRDHRETRGGRAFGVVVIDSRTAEGEPELAGQLGTELARDGVPLVVLSPLSRSGPCELFGAHVAAHVSKPVRRTQLSRALGRALGIMPAPEQQGAVPAREARPCKVLVVEDNAINQKVALGLLDRLGHTAALAGNGVEALEVLGRDSFDLVLLDCQMPEMDGYEMAQQFRQSDANRSTPLIAMTANAMPGDRQRCLDAGMDDYVTKPLTLDVLRRVIENWTEQERPRAPDR